MMLIADPMGCLLHFPLRIPMGPLNIDFVNVGVPLSQQINSLKKIRCMKVWAVEGTVQVRWLAPEFTATHFLPYFLTIPLCGQ